MLISEKGENMKLTRKQIIVITVVVAVFMSINIVFALTHMDKSLKLSGGVRHAEMGIEIFDEDGVIPLEDFNFPKFPEGIENTYYKTFFINNTGDFPVSVEWNIETSTLDWTLIDDEYYAYFEDTSEVKSVLKYEFKVFIYWDGIVVDWYPEGNHYLTLDVGQGVRGRLLLRYTGEPSTLDKFKLNPIFSVYEYSSD